MTIAQSAHSAPNGITAIVTAFCRLEETLRTLKKVGRCTPPPSEILVHVDGNETACAIAIRQEWPDVRVILSEANVGPGGGRNKLVQASSYPIVASFDDDSYPIDGDYFARLMTVFDKFPDAAVVSGRVYHVDEVVQEDRQLADWVSDFSGGACAYRREIFLRAGGYVPLPVAYGMEEVDFAIRLHEQGGRVLHTEWLRVFHDTDRARHADPLVTAASISNLALLTYLRYPVSLWLLGLGQCVNRIQWLVRNGRQRGIFSGIAGIPSQLLKHRSFRDRLPAKAVLSYLGLRRHPVPVDRPLVGEHV